MGKNKVTELNKAHGQAVMTYILSEVFREISLLSSEHIIEDKLFYEVFNDLSLESSFLDDRKMLNPINIIGKTYHLCIKEIRKGASKEVLQAQPDYYDGLTDPDEVYTFLNETCYETIQTCGAVINFTEDVEIRLSLKEFFGCKNPEKIKADYQFNEVYAFNIEELAEAYNNLPFRCKKFESDLLRLYIFFSALGTCSSYRKHHPWFKFPEESLDIKTLSNGQFTIKNGRSVSVITAGKSSFIEDILIFFPFVYMGGIFFLFYSFFEQPGWKDLELYISILTALLLGDHYRLRNDESWRTRNREDKIAKKNIIRFYTDIYDLILSAVSKKQIRIDDILNHRFFSETEDMRLATIPWFIECILNKAKEEGDNLIEGL